MAQAFDIRTFAIDGTQWWPISPSINCNYWSVRAAADCHVRTNPNDSGTEDDLPAGAEDGVTASPIVLPGFASTASLQPRFVAGVPVVYIKSQVGAQVVVARFVLALLMALLLPGLARAQRANVVPVLPTQSATLSSATCAGTGCITANVQGFGTVGVQVTGTWSGTLQFVGSLDKVNFVAINCTPPNSTSAVTTTTGNGVWTCGAAGLAQVQVGFNGGGSFVSGSAVVTIQPAPGGGGGGGGGGGASGSVTINDPNTTSQKAAVNASGQLSITCANCSGSGASAVDNSAYTAGTTSGAPAMGFYHSTIDTVTDNHTATLAMDSKRNLFTVIRDAADNARGVNVTAGNALTVDASATTQPVSGTFWQSTQPVSVADGSDTTLGAKADAKNTATDTTAISAISILKEISFMEQTPASRAVTNAGTFAVQAATTIADGADTTLGSKADAKNTATDTTAVSVVSVLKEISAMEQAPASRAVTNAGTFAVQAAQATASSLNATVVYPNADPCLGNAKSYASINQTGTTQILGASGSSKRYYICSINLVSATAQNVGLIDSTTAGNACATSPSGSDGFGGTTTGSWNLAANGGIAYGNGGASLGQTHNTNAALCVYQSSSGQVSGGFSYVTQ